VALAYLILQENCIMSPEERSRLNAELDSLKLQLRALDAAVPEEALRGQIGEHYVRELESLTDSEAAEHLRSVDESRVQGAYLVLSTRLDRAVLASICLEYMRRPGHRARHTGVQGIGSCLKGSGNPEACRALARIICNQKEPRDTRIAAYGSLELIEGVTNRRTSVAGGKRVPRDPELGDIDWALVESFDPNQGE
jgi:hypothetical protein